MNEITCIQVSNKISRKFILYEALRGNGPFKTLMEVSKLQVIKST